MNSLPWWPTKYGSFQLGGAQPLVHPRAASGLQNRDSGFESSGYHRDREWKNVILQMGRARALGKKGNIDLPRYECGVKERVLS